MKNNLEKKFKRSTKKKTVVLLTIIASLTFISVLIFGAGVPEYGSDFSSCHSSPSNVSIEIMGSEEISGNASSQVIFNLTAMGANVIIQVTPGIDDNDLFVILPTTDKISDNSIYDLDSNPDIITVEFNVTAPATVGSYTLFILAAEDPFSASKDPFTYISVTINVGEISEPSNKITPTQLFLNNYNYYLGGLTVIFLSIGTILFQINLNKKKESKIQGIFMISAFVLITINIFLMINDTMDFTFKSMELTNSQRVDQLIHIILGSIGYITGIVVVFGTFTHVPGSKLKLFVYIMLLVWTINFFFESFIPTGG